MDEAAFHAHMNDLWRDQKAARQPQPRPDGIGKEQWKNRHLISAKLGPANYADLMSFCRSNNFSVNTAIDVILTAFFRNHNV